MSKAKPKAQKNTLFGYFGGSPKPAVPKVAAKKASPPPSDSKKLKEAFFTPTNANPAKSSTFLLLPPSYASALEGKSETFFPITFRRIIQGGDRANRGKQKEGVYLSHCLFQPPQLPYGRFSR
jgi:hypothetical protein